MTGNNALLLIETKGMCGLVDAQDRIPKTSDVEFFHFILLGGGHAITVFQGPVAELIYAYERNLDELKKLPELHAASIIKGPHPDLYGFIKKEKIEYPESSAALGIVETKGFVPMAVAADDALKSGFVTARTWITIGGGITSFTVRGDVASVRSAVEHSEAGVPEPYKYRHLVIDNPHQDIDEKRLEIRTGHGQRSSAGPAIGFFETRSFAALMRGVDAGLKKGATELTGIYKTGSTLISAGFTGTLSETESALNAACSAAGELMECRSRVLIPNRHREVDRIL